MSVAHAAAATRRDLVLPDGDVGDPTALPEPAGLGRPTSVLVHGAGVGEIAADLLAPLLALDGGLVIADDTAVGDPAAIPGGVRCVVDLRDGGGATALLAQRHGVPWAVSVGDAGSAAALRHALRRAGGAPFWHVRPAPADVGSARVGVHRLRMATRETRDGLPIDALTVTVDAQGALAHWSVDPDHDGLTFRAAWCGGGDSTTAIVRSLAHDERRWIAVRGTLADGREVEGSATVDASPWPGAW